MLVAAGLGTPGEHALNGLRDPEATGADIEHLGLERGHRMLTITRKGGKVVTIPLAPRTARAIDLALGERTDGPLFLAADGRRLDRHGAGRIIRRVAQRAGITKRVSLHTLRHAFITTALDAGVPLRDVQEAASHSDPLTTDAVVTGPVAAWTGTPRMSSPPTSRAPPGSSFRLATTPPGGWSRQADSPATAHPAPAAAAVVTCRNSRANVNRLMRAGGRVRL